MKTLLIAAAALSLTAASAVLAQTSAPNGPTPAAKAGDPAQGDPGQKASAAQSAGAAAEGGAQTGMTADARSLYPMCSSRIHDNCQQRSQAMRTAAINAKAHRARAGADQTGAPGV